jgi:uncharacterized protein with HEPN domain
MLDATRRAVSFAASRSRSDLAEDDIPTLGLIKSIEVIGEAASKVGEETRILFHEIPWQALVGMRNRMVHGYDTIDLDVVWDTVKNSLPPLIPQLESALDRLEDR